MLSFASPIPFPFLASPPTSSNSSYISAREEQRKEGGGRVGADSELSHKISQGRNEVLIKKAGVLCKWLLHRRQPNECARSGWGAFAAPTAGSQEGQEQAGAREHNPSDWQLCPLVTVWLSPKLLYFTEIMIFYGHRFEDNCCILRVVVLQGDTAASFRRARGGERVSSPFLSLATYFLEMFYYHNESNMY